ncbi:uncharacterized protein LOC127138017 [Lathyrus oleraceus]|uniref:uncharacterized protein LOC127138017 n=1 Tax=Pisum sativum TaxID=3888 RepID=UPI0021D2B2B3|nr:uncharacterized protein LOC127138017 [Pisum sativum]
MEASKLGFGVVIRMSDNGSDRRCNFMTMICERSGKYRTSLQKFKRDGIGSRKCDYLFKVHGYMLENKNWRFNVICCLYNHDLCEKLVGHPSVCRLMLEEKEYVADMTLNLVQLKNILVTLKWKRPKNISNIKQVYKIWYRTCEDGVTIREIFWTHPDSMKLFNMFHTVIILDSTYKTKNFRLPLLKMVGVTSTEKTYVIEFSFLECEKEENFTWALEVWHTLLKDQGEMPKVIVTYHDTTLMNLVAKNEEV